MAMNGQAELRQREYYSRTAVCYDDWHTGSKDEHTLAAHWLLGMCAPFGIESIVDVGAGSCRLSRLASERNSPVTIINVDPVLNMLRQNKTKAKAAASLVADGRKLPLKTRSVDCATAFGVLHHVPDPQKLLAELFRVSQVAVLVSDHDIYCWGSQGSRRVKRLLRAVLGRQLCAKLFTRGKGYWETVDDGISYPFALLDSLRDLDQKFTAHSLSFRAEIGAASVTSSHVAILMVREG